MGDIKKEEIDFKIKVGEEYGLDIVFKKWPENVYDEKYLKRQLALKRDYIDSIDPIKSYKITDKELIINNGFYEYKFYLEDIKDLKAYKV